jgi:hypothetical protein
MFFFKSTDKKIDQILEMRIKLLEERVQILVAENEALKNAILTRPCLIDNECKDCCQSTIKNWLEMWLMLIV